MSGRSEIDVEERESCDTDTNGQKSEQAIVVKLQRAHGGYLGTQRRRRTWLPTICPGELEASIDPGVSEWGNPKYGWLNP